MTGHGRRPRVAVLGGGMASLTAAWRLSGPGWRDEFDSITVYERDWRLGGKGASSRGVNGRIEEHGLHVLLGYYENTFGVIREVYGELDRPTTDPTCPIRTWRDAFRPAPNVGVEDQRAGRWRHWLATFPVSDDEPGADPPPVLTPQRFVTRAVELLLTFVSSATPTERSSSDGPFRLTASPPGSGAGIALMRSAGAAALALAAELVKIVAELGDPMRRANPVLGDLLASLGDVRVALERRAETDVAAGRMLELTDLVATSIRGIVVDGLLTGPIGFPAIDHLDFREWLAEHGAHRETLESAVVRGLYDLVFAYEDGDHERPSFSAGLGLFLAGKLFFDYRGSMFWTMAAGMGDVVFAPMFQALVARGVRFELLHRVDRLELSQDGSRVIGIHITREAVPANGRTIDPLVRVRGLPCFPSRLPADRLRPDTSLGLRIARERDTDHGGQVTLRDGDDFDVVVFGLSVGMVPIVGRDIVERHQRWRAMIDAVATVPTQAVQLWLRPDESALGWHVPGAIVSAYATPFDTFASMSHLAEVEDWPDEDRPGTIAYFCSALQHVPGEDPDRLAARVRFNAERFVGEGIQHFFPRAGVRGTRGLDPSLLCGSSGADTEGPLDSQWLVAAVDPSDRFVQSRPGSGAFRIRPDQSGIANLVPAGDWVASGLDAGCLESAVLAGIQAANVVRGRPLREGVRGQWPGGAA